MAEQVATNTVCYRSVSRVLSCWEHTHQMYSCREEIGTAILVQLFLLVPETKLVFGFKLQDNLDSNPMKRLALVIHGQRIVNMIDQVLDLMGPDLDVLKEVLSDQIERHQRHGVKKEYFAHMGTAIRNALRQLIIEEKKMSNIYTDDIDLAWKEVFDVCTDIILQGR